MGDPLNIIMSCPVVKPHGLNNIDEAGTINPDNQMPYPEILESLPLHDPEAENLALHREASTIPKTSTHSTWTYPSERMFYSALRRKGHEPAAEDIPAMLTIHNFLNEAVWAEVLRWEVIKDPKCTVSLERFWGRFGEWTPRSWFFCNIMGAPLPFDRHDWVIRRCDGTSARYIIDYYPSNEGDAVFNCDVRPALDSFANAKLRMVSAFIEFKEYIFNKVQST